jgi:hypothetical protein
MTDKIKAYNGNVVHLRKPKSNPGGWLASKKNSSRPAMDERDRVGRQAASVLFGASVLSSEQYGSYNRILTNEQLWLVYQRVPDVRACVDAICRRVATWNWLIAPTASPDTDGYDKLLDEADRAQSFLKAPNRDGETWQEIWTKVITDLLVFDAGVIENVYGGKWTKDGIFDANGDLEELVALRGSTIYPIVDQFGHVEGYKQSYTGVDASNLSYTQEGTEDGAAKRALFTPEQIIYMRVFANTQSPLGSPVIESIVNEVITMLRSSEHTMLAMDADEIPPGILVLTGIAGQAASAAMADLQNMRGKDHKVRVITTPDPKGTGASWVELRHKAKDVDFVNVIGEVRRTIWRVFGVLPIEMGATEDIPRSVGQVQLDVSTSHLINPILELIEAKINARLLPLIIKDKSLLKDISFTFDRESKLSTLEQKEKSAALNTFVMQGLMTRNEARQDLGLAPVVDGDVMTITTGQGTFTLKQIVGGTGGMVTEPTDNEGGPGTASSPDNEELEELEELEEIEPMSVLGHSHDNDGDICTRDLMGNEDLPSEWQPAGKFSDVRTVDLVKLHNVVVEYQKAILPIYDKMKNSIVSEVSSNYKPNSLTDADAITLISKINNHIDRLGIEWDMVSEKYYEKAGSIGANAARNFTGQQVLSNVLQKSLSYGDEAMVYLTNTGGLLNDLKVEMTMLIAAMSIESNAVPETRAIYDVPDKVNQAMDVSEAAKVASEMVDAQKFRTSNWTGKLVNLCTSAMAQGLIEGSSVVSQDSNEPAIVPTEWYAEWVSVGDGRTCPTCAVEGEMGFRRVEDFTLMPGGQTECGAKCRCVIVVWTKNEVLSGTATSFSNTIS